LFHQLQIWIDDACSAYLSADLQPQASNALEELCFMIMGFLQKSQFLFHYSKTHDSDNSDILSSVVHPLLQLVPHLHERRLKRYKADVCNFKLFGRYLRGHLVQPPAQCRNSTATASPTDGRPASV
uniref:Neuromedin U n=1 Tax=Sphenodon punctatus TaxID=8508 RepID=A0A8D0HNG4_SPHPU